jgi:hypothetical protein
MKESWVGGIEGVGGNLHIPGPVLGSGQSIR